jgi:hypothetical protein
MLQYIQKVEQFVLQKSNYLYIFFSFSIVLLSIYKLYRFVYVWHDGWLLADWLINYEDGGFKRRGFSGSLFFMLQDLTGISLPALVMGIQLVLMILFFLLFYNLIKRKAKNSLLILFCVSPVAFSFWLYQTHEIGRKDILIFIYFLLLIFYIEQKKRNVYLEFYFVISAIILVLFHELFIFYIPFVFALFFIFNQIKPYKIDIKFIISICFSCFITAIMILIFGKKINEGNTLQILKSRGVERYIDNGILTFSFDQNEFFQRLFWDYLSFIIPIILAFISLKWIIQSIQLKPALQQKILTFIILNFIFSLPLFYLAIDWGRWIFIHCILWIIILSSLNKMEISIISFFKINNNIKAIVLSIILFAYLFLWNMAIDYPGFIFLNHFWRRFFALF